MMDIGYMHEHFMAITSVQTVSVETHMIGTSGDTQCRGLFRSFNYTGVTTLVQTSFGYYPDLLTLSLLVELDRRKGEDDARRN